MENGGKNNNNVNKLMECHHFPTYSMLVVFLFFLNRVNFIKVIKVYDKIFQKDIKSAVKYLEIIRVFLF